MLREFFPSFPATSPPPPNQGGARHFHGKGVVVPTRGSYKIQKVILKNLQQCSNIREFPSPILCRTSDKGKKTNRQNLKFLIGDVRIFFGALAGIRSRKEKENLRSEKTNVLFPSPLEF
ncbi:hypothetical protein DLM78_18465 [Leptospira stimsonii]|uniref:Uncharacterized protein n=1 Tax=Leptospira stimsonii TaxID=2202203 RepID=A0A8B3CM24_9LEPT|nr:hypothetical protein DLM78_18465 [Leptospira stimsonii]